MALFRRTHRSPFPADMLPWLERFGRSSFDSISSGIDNTDIWQRLAPLHAFATSDREGFLSALEALVADDRGGFATFGAARLVWEMYGGDSLDIPAALPLIDAGIEFKRQRGLLPLMLTGYEQTRLQQRRDRPS